MSTRVWWRARDAGQRSIRADLVPYGNQTGFRVIDRRLALDEVGAQ